MFLGFLGQAFVEMFLGFWVGGQCFCFFLGGIPKPNPKNPPCIKHKIAYILQMIFSLAKC